MQAGTKTKVTLFSRSPSDRSRKIFQNSLTPLSPVPFYLFIYLFIYHSLSWRIIPSFLSFFFFCFFSPFSIFIIATTRQTDTEIHAHTCTLAHAQTDRTHGRTDGQTRRKFEKFVLSARGGRREEKRRNRERGR